MPQTVNCMTCIQADKGSTSNDYTESFSPWCKIPTPDLHFIWLFAIGPLSASRKDCLWNCSEPLGRSCYQKYKKKLRNDFTYSGKSCGFSQEKKKKKQCQETLQLSLHIILSWVDRWQTNNNSNVNINYILRVF